MSKNLYIASVEPASGKSLVSLGVMELLSRRIERLGFFRPVILGKERRDNAIELIRRRYLPELPYESLYAATHDEAQTMVAEGRSAGLLKRIVAAYKALERQCDFVLCEGTNYTGATSAFEFEFNVQVANHLGCPVLIVGCGQGKDSERIVNGTCAVRKEFAEQGCTVAATVVNRVPQELLPTVTKTIKKIWSDEDPVYFLPEHDTLDKPTVGKIASVLGAERLCGSDSQLSHEVFHFKVAAMHLSNFLGHIQHRCLVIVPGDRADVILGSLVAAVSENFPQVAGIILTGGLKPTPEIMRLIEGFKHPTPPIFCVETDTYSTAMKVHDVHPMIAPDNDRKIASALGIFEGHVDLNELEQRISVSRSTRVTPIMFEYNLIERAKAKRQHIVFPEGAEERILRASEILLRREVVEITLLGDADEIRQRITSLGLSLERAQIVEPARANTFDDYAQTYLELRKHKGITEEVARDMMGDVSYFGTMMVYKGAASGMVSGAVHTTAHTIRPAFEFIRAQPGVSLISSVFLMCLDDRVLVYGDCAVNPNPTPEQLADIAISSAATATTFGIEPRIAMLSYATGESGKGEDVNKVRKATNIAQELRPDLKIEGPIQYDAAIDAGVAKTKMPKSNVAGQATVFIFPDLNTGNNTYKAVQRSAHAVAIGPVLQGLNKPVNDLSRGCTVTDIVNTAAITAIQAQAMAPKK